MFSDGPHLATRSFEIGDPGLEEERALNFSATLRGAGPRWSVAGTVYYTQFNDFIYQAATGEEMDELMVREFAQADATFSGLDVEASLVLADWGDARLEVRGFFDTVSAELDVSGNDSLPLIPPDRAGIGMEYTAGAFSASLDYSRVSEQNSVAVFELPTDGYDDLRAYVRYGIERGDTLTETVPARQKPYRRRAAPPHLHRQGSGPCARPNGRGRIENQVLECFASFRMPVFLLLVSHAHG